MNNRVYDYKKDFNKTVTENEYLCEWTEEGGYRNQKGTAYFMAFLLEEFNLDTDDLRTIANLKQYQGTVPQVVYRIRGILFQLKINI